MGKTLLLFCLGLLTLLLTACSHTYVLPMRQSQAASTPKLAGKNVVLALTTAKVAETYAGKAGGHNFSVVNVHNFVSHFITTLLSSSSASFQTVRDGQPKPPADIVFIPTLNLTYKSGFATQSCVADFTLEAQDRQGTTLSTSNQQGEYKFMVMKNGGRACEIAMYNAIAPAIDAVLAGL